jgi:2-haloalkanoic acid dehalogenase type II
MKIIAFDVFGTVFNLDKIPTEEINYYGNHIRQQPWQPLNLPNSWQNIPAHPDAAEGIAILRQHYQVITLSNCPMKLLTKLSKNNHISWDAIIPLESYQIYKPNPKAYQIAIQLMDEHPNNIMMVTANPTFGDIEQATNLDMIPQIIRHSHHPKDILELAKIIC